MVFWLYGSWYCCQCVDMHASLDLAPPRFMISFGCWRCLGWGIASKSCFVFSQTSLSIIDNDSSLLSGLVQVPLQNDVVSWIYGIIMLLHFACWSCCLMYLGVFSFWYKTNIFKHTFAQYLSFDHLQIQCMLGPRKRLNNFSFLLICFVHSLFVLFISYFLDLHHFRILVCLDWLFFVFFIFFIIFFLCFFFSSCSFFSLFLLLFSCSLFLAFPFVRHLLAYSSSALLIFFFAFLTLSLRFSSICISFVFLFFVLISFFFFFSSSYFFVIIFFSS